MGLKLESRKSTADELVVDHVEKTPAETKATGIAAIPNRDGPDIFAGVMPGYQ